MFLGLLFANFYTFPFFEVLMNDPTWRMKTEFAAPNERMVLKVDGEGCYSVEYATRLLTWFGRLSNTAHPYSKSISIIEM